MKTINLFLKVNLTSQSPDGQIISVGIVSDGQEDEINVHKTELHFASQDELRKKNYMPEYLKIKGLNGSLEGYPEKPFKASFDIPENQFVDSGYLCTHVECGVYLKNNIETYLTKPKSFYSEFSDFDINRCDDWTKENVAGKLLNNNIDWQVDVCGTRSNTKNVIFELKEWLSQFSDYQIQFIVDKGSWEWVKFCELIGEWKKEKEFALPFNIAQENTFKRHEEELKLFQKANGREIMQYSSQPITKVTKTESKFTVSMERTGGFYILNRVGSPILPENISPVPLDLNDLIAFKFAKGKSISAKEAATIDRCVYNNTLDFEDKEQRLINLLINGCEVFYIDLSGKYNALSDAKVIKEVFNKLK